MSSENYKKPAEPVWDEIYTIYEKVQRAPLPERGALAHSLCAGQPELLAEVQFLLENAPTAESFLEESVGPKLAAALKPETFSLGDTIEDFRLTRVLGKGSFATVYLARQISLDREVALKFSPNFGDEGRTIAQLEHEGIVRVFSETTLPRRNIRLVAMQYIASITLDQLMKSLSQGSTKPESGGDLLKIIDSGLERSATLTAEAYRDREAFANMAFGESVAWLGARIADALAHAHTHGILHLDVKPSNILLAASGRPSLTDFNVSVQSESLKAGVPTQFGGTFDYMSPEQRAVFTSTDPGAAVAKVDGRSDLYSLGVILKGMLARGDQKRPPDELDWILERATAPEPRDRFASAAALARALDGYAELNAIRLALPRSGRIARAAEKRPIVVLTLLGALPQMVAGVFGVSYNSIRIVGELSLRQQELFHSINVFYNPILYGGCSLLWLSIAMRLTGILTRPQSYVRRESEVETLRAQALRLPVWGMIITTIGWAPGSLIFPAGLHWYGGGLTAATIGHFFISFLLSYCIALAYSYLIQQWIFMRAIYPHLWIGCDNISRTAARELAPIANRIRLTCFLASIIPLVGAGLMIAVGPDRFEGEAYGVFRILVTSLIFMGAAGVIFALMAAQDMAKSIFGFVSRNQVGKAGKVR